MRAQVHLRFLVDVEDEIEAWKIAEGLESAAVARDYVGVSGWVEAIEGRGGVLVPQGQEPIMTEAEKLERVPRGSQLVTSVGFEGGSLSPVLPGSQDE